MEEKLNLAKDKLKELLDVHNEHPFTNNERFRDNRRSYQTSRSKKIVEQQLNDRVSHTLTKGDIESLLSQLVISKNDDVDMVAAEDAYNNMNAYYNVGFLTIQMLHFLWKIAKRNRLQKSSSLIMSRRWRSMQQFSATCTRSSAQAWLTGWTRRS